jgi:O-antigen ligase
MRLGGQLYLFDYLPPVNKFIGVGINQLQNYFIYKSQSVHNYSNSFIIVLINTGILGLIIYVLFLVFVGIRAIDNKTTDYFIIFVLIAVVDYFIFNPFFYYVLTFIFLNNRSLERKK